MTPIPSEALTRHIAILGSTGSGKTTAAKSGVVEPILVAKGRVLVVDPTAAWWGLRLAANGKGSGFPIYIFGGDHGDYPLRSKDAAALAEAFGTSSDSAIFDTSLMTVNDRSGFFTEFALALLRRNRGPLNLVIDESHLFMPQVGAKVGGMVPAMLHAGNNLVSLGRSKGIRVTMITQRPAKLHKDSLTQAQSLVAMRVLAPQDRKAIGEWIAEQAEAEKGKEILASLSGLKAGEAWVWAPMQGVLERVKFALPKTFDSSKAPDEMSGSGPVLAPINLDALKSRLSTIEAETKANDPKALKAEIAALRQQLIKSPKPDMTDPKAVEEAERRGFERGVETVRQTVIPKVQAIGAQFFEATDQVVKAKEAVRAFVDEWRKPEYPGPSKPVSNVQSGASRYIERPAAPWLISRKTNGSGDASLSGPQRKLLTVLAQYPDGRNKKQLAILAGYAHNGGAFNNPLSRLRAQGMIVGGAERLVITEAGLAALGDWEPLPTGADLRTYWLDNLPGPAAKLLRVLSEVYPAGMDKATLAQKTGYEPSGGAFNNPLARLRSLELVTGRGTAKIRASEDLF